MTSQTVNTTATKPTRKKRGCLFWLGVTAGVFFVLFLIFVGMLWYGYSQALAKPEFYKERDALLVRIGPVELERIANEAERRITDTITQPHGPGTVGGPANGAGSFEVVMTFEQINAWLATRFNGWAKHQQVTIPSTIKGVMMAQEGGNLIFASEVDNPQFKGVISMKFHVELVDKGPNPSLMIKLVSVQSGNVPVAGWVLKSVLGEDGGQGQGQNAQKWLDLLGEGYKVPASGVLDPKSNRHIRMDELEVTAEGIRAKMTELNGKGTGQPGAPVTQPQPSTRQPEGARSIEGVDQR